MKKENILTERKTVFGFKTSDLFGILIMIIPCAISALWESETSQRVIPFVPWITKTVRHDIRPDLIAMFFSVAFYAALIIRHNIFRKESLIEAIISVFRMIVDCWALSALIKIVIDTDDGGLISIFAFQFNTYFMLLLAVILSWIGMKTLSGYSWILFIIAGVKHLEEINNAMGMWGAVFILTIAVSLFLQINDFSNITDFMSDFRNATGKYSSDIRENVNAAVNDASSRIQETVENVKDISANSAPGHIEKNA